MEKKENKMADGGGISESEQYHYKKYLEFKDKAEELLNSDEMPSKYETPKKGTRSYDVGKRQMELGDEAQKHFSMYLKLKHERENKMADGGKIGSANIDDIKSLNGYFHAYHSGPMAGKKDEGYVAIQDEYDLEKYITDKLGNVVKKVVLIEKEKDYPYNMSNPYFDDIYDVELKDGRKFQVVRSYGRPNWAGNVSYKEQIQVKYA